MGEADMPHLVKAAAGHRPAGPRLERAADAWRPDRAPGPGHQPGAGRAGRRHRGLRRPGRPRLPGRPAGTRGRRHPRAPACGGTTPAPPNHPCTSPMCLRAAAAPGHGTIIRPLGPHDTAHSRDGRPGPPASNAGCGGRRACVRRSRSDPLAAASVTCGEADLGRAECEYRQ
jgi:hypothetical protein